MRLISLSIPVGPDSVSQEILVPTGIPSNIKLGVLVQAAIELLLVVGILLSLIYLLYGGVSWTQSKGDKETLDKARRVILYAILGLIIMSLSLVAVNVFTSAIGVSNLIRR